MCYAYVLLLLGLVNEIFYYEKDIQMLDSILWQREIPMAWGTTTDSLTPKINPSNMQ